MARTSWRVAASQLHSPALSPSRIKADDSSVSLLMDTSLPLLPIRDHRAKAVPDATLHISIRTSPGKALDALDDDQLEQLAWQSVGQEQRQVNTTSRPAASGQPSAGVATTTTATATTATACSSSPSLSLPSDHLTHSTPLQLISSPNIEVRRRKMSRISLCRPVPDLQANQREDQPEEDEGQPVMESRDARRQRLGLTTASNAQSRGHSVTSGKLQAAHQTSQSSSPSKRSLPSMLPFSPYHKKQRPTRDVVDEVVEGPITNVASTSSSSPLRDDHPSELLRLLRRDPDGAKAPCRDRDPTAAISWLKRGADIRTHRGNKPYARQEEAPETVIAGSRSARRKSSRRGAVTEEDDLSVQVQVREAIPESKGRLGPSPVVDEALQSTSIALAKSPKAPLSAHSAPRLDDAKRKTKDRRCRATQVEEESRVAAGDPPSVESRSSSRLRTRASTHAQDVEVIQDEAGGSSGDKSSSKETVLSAVAAAVCPPDHLLSTSSTGGDSSTSSGLASEKPDIHSGLEKPQLNGLDLEGQSKGSDVDDRMKRSVGDGGIEQAQLRLCYRKTPTSAATTTTLPSSTRVSLIDLIDTTIPRKPTRVSRRRPATITSPSTSSGLQAASSEVPLGYRKTSTGNLVPLPPSAEPSTYVTASGQFAKALAQAEEEEKRIRSKSEVSKAHKVPDYLAKRREEIERESAEMLQREVELMRNRELRGTQQAQRRRLAALPKGLLGVGDGRRGSGTRSTSSAKPRPTQPQPFVSSLDTRLLERRAYEKKRSARDAVLEEERGKVREEKRRLEEEEIQRERDRRIPKARPVPDFIYSGTVGVRAGVEVAAGGKGLKSAVKML